MKWPEEYINQIICGDCLEVMKGMPDNSIDTIITDPPYGLSFMGKKWDYKVPSIKIWQECLRVLKPGGTALIFAGSRTQHRMAVNVEDAGFILKDCIMWLYGSGFPKASDISKNIDKIAGKERKIIGTKQHQYPDSPHLGTYKKVNISSDGIFQSENKNTNLSAIPITAPATPEATLWNGWKSFGLKPAYEPILCCMKPNEGSYANNALKWGVAGLNIKESRIPYKIEDAKNRLSRDGKDKARKNITKGFLGFATAEETHTNIEAGRYPANVILDDSPEVMNEFEKHKTSGNSYRPTGSRGKGIINGDIPFNKGLKRKGAILGYDDSGSPSRFFYCAKASKVERNRGCEELEEKYNDDSRKDKNAISCNNPRNSNRSGTPKKNSHPTVKPLALMKYLCTLTKTPTGGIVLDPFCGSGTTLMACKELKRHYVGIDDIHEYCEIARRRVNATPELLF